MGTSPARAPLSPPPALRRYDGDRLARVALPLGGIGTGSVSLGGRGDLRDWELDDRPAQGFAPPSSFFALRCRGRGAEPVVRVLEGELAPPYDGWMGAAAPNAGLPRFRDCSFDAAYPFGTVRLSDPDVPVTVRLEAFNPLVPGDAEASGWPIAVLRYVVGNPTDAAADVAVCGSVRNYARADEDGGRAAGRNEPRESRGLRGVLLVRGGEPLRAGTLALATDADTVTVRTAWRDAIPSDALLDFWDDFAADGRLGERDGGGQREPVASVAALVCVPPGEERAVTFVLAWHVPDRAVWIPPDTTRVGNHYATRFADAWNVAEQAVRELPALEARTRRFVEAFAAADVPDAVKEAALFTLTPLRSQTSFRTTDGRLHGWEGCADDAGACFGSCTHVWNYEQATAHLFGDLSRSLREVELLHATREDGHMSFRVELPLGRATAFGVAAADGQMGCLVKLYRDWQLCGDDAFLRRLWPAARRALEFAWSPGGWDADRDGVMEGTQHVTFDVELHGPNPLTGVWYLAALRAASAMAGHLGDADFAAECGRLADSGRRWLDERLFNGDYYEQEVRPPADAPAPGLTRAVFEDAGGGTLRHQLGPACLSDQLVGQLLAHLSGLGHLVDPAHARAALESVYRFNFRADLRGHVNHFRTYALNDEAALLLASYPRGGRPAQPMPYVSEVWSGVEYAAAAGMMYEGLRDEGLRCVEAVRARYDGRRRNPFSEVECGRHYARSMAAWATLLAWTGFRYSAVEGAIRFRATEVRSRVFWSTGGAWGTFEQRPVPEGAAARLTVEEGRLPLRRLVLDGAGAADLPPSTLTAGQAVEATVEGRPA